MKRLAVFLPVFLLGCPTAQYPLPTPAVVDTDWCDDAELFLEAFQCVDMRGDPMWVNKKGVRFTEICEEAQEKGGIFLDPRCVAEAPNCTEAKKCPIRNH